MITRDEIFSILRQHFSEQARILKSIVAQRRHKPSYLSKAELDRYAAEETERIWAKPDPETGLSRNDQDAIKRGRKIGRSVNR